MSTESQALDRRGYSVQETGLSTTTDFSSELAPTAAAAEKQFEIQSAVVLAKRFPRDEDGAFQRLMKACGRTSFAEDAEYSFPRGNKLNDETGQWEKNFVNGPSINLAREGSRVWGNMRHGFVVTTDTENERTIMGFAWDLETNTRVQAEDSFKKLVYRRKDGWVKPDERDLRELTNRRAAILKRNCILEILPKDLIEDALDECRKTLRSNAEKDPDGERKKILMAFSQLNISAEMLTAYLGHAVGQSSPAEIADLRAVYKSISDGNTTWADYVNGNTEASAADLKDKTKAKTDALKDKLKGDDKANAKPEGVDVKAETKARKEAIKKKYKELGWDEKKQDQYQGGKDIHAYSLDELDKLNDDLTGELADQ
jgi:hypothetical protein